MKLSRKQKKSDPFDYEDKVWGASTVRVNPLHLGALRLKYCLESIKHVDGKVVEIGCGAGGMVKAVKNYRPDLDVYGCDVSKTAIKEARESSGDVKFEVADIYKMPFKDNAFEAVVMFDLLEHLDKPEVAVREIFRILKPGGVFHSYTPCEGNWSNYDFYLRKLGWKGKERYAGHIQKYSEGSLKELIEGVGFKMGEAKWSNHLINQVADALYFLFLSIRGKNTDYSVEGFVSKSKPGLIRWIMSVAAKAVAVGTYFESRFLYWAPGHGLHLTMVKS